MAPTEVQEVEEDTEEPEDQAVQATEVMALREAREASGELAEMLLWEDLSVKTPAPSPTHTQEATLRPLQVRLAMEVLAEPEVMVEPLAADQQARTAMEAQAEPEERAATLMPEDS